MRYTDTRIVDSYSGLFEGLSSLNKIELIERLSKSLKTDVKDKDKAFYKAFGAFSPGKSAKAIVKDIRTSRKFRKSKLTFDIVST